MAKYVIKYGGGGSGLDSYLVEITNDDNPLWSTDIDDAKKMDSEQDAMEVQETINNLGFYAETLFIEEAPNG